MKAKADLSGLFGILILILLVMVATAAYISYKNPNINDLILWGSVGVIGLFIIGLLFFGGVKISTKHPTRLAKIPVPVLIGT